MKIIKERRKNKENQKIMRKDTILDKLSKTKQIYVIKNTTKMINSEISKMDIFLKRESRRILELFKKF